MTSPDGLFRDKFRTHDDPLTGVVSLRVPVPRALWFQAHFMNALWALTIPDNWESEGSVSIDDAISAASTMLAGVTPMTGEIILTAWSSIPDGYLACDGATHDREDYPALYAVLAPVFIVDADTFTVPNLVDRIPVGAGAAFDIGDYGGEMEHVLDVSEIPAHDHTITGAGGTLSAPGAVPTTTPSILPGISGSTGGGGAHNNMQPYVALQYLIVAG